MESADTLRSWQRILLATTVGALLLVLAGAQYCIRVDPADATATAVFVAAAVLAAVVLAGRDDAVAAPAIGLESPPFPTPRIVHLGCAAIVAGSVVLSVRWHGAFVTGVAIFLLGVTTLSIGLARWETRTAASALPWTRVEAAALLAIVAVAFFLRFYRFTDFPDPYGIFAIEEPQTGMGGFLILQGRRPWEFLLDHYLAALALRVGGPTLPAVRVPFAFFSALTVVPMYLLLRQLVRKPAALFGTFLLAASSWHLIYARGAHNIFLTAFFVVVVLALLVAAERTHRMALFPWIGLIGGYTLYTYAGYRGTMAFIVLFLAMVAARHRRAARRHDVASVYAQQALVRDLQGLAVVLFVVVAMIPPIVVQVVRDPRHVSYFEAAGRATNDSAYYTKDVRAFIEQRVERTRDAAAIFLHYGDISPTFNYPGAPMLDPITGTCFVVGLLYALCFPWRGHNAFFLIMFAVLFVGGTIFVHNLDVRRLQGIIPLVVLFAALFVDRFLAAAERLGRRAVRAVSGLAMLAGLAVLGWSYDFYFNQMAKDPTVRAAFSNEYTQLIRLGLGAARGHYLLLISDVPNFFLPSDYYWLIKDQINGHRLVDLATILPPRRLPHMPGPLSIVIQPPLEGAAIADLLGSVYPGVVCREDADPQAPRLVATVCDVPAGAAAPDTGNVGTLSARYSLDPPPEGLPVLERLEPFISYALVPPICQRRVVSPSDRECYADWTGTFDLPDEMTVSFLPKARAGSVTVLIDGQPAEPDMHLASGQHAFHASAHFPRDDETGVQVMWQLPGQPATLMPFYKKALSDE